MKVYVGTYAKYNDGSAAGDWIDLEDFPDKESFLAECARVHCTETDPEFMFQDWEDVPLVYQDESHLSDDLWDFVFEVTHSRLGLEVFLAAAGCDIEPGDVEERYMGEYASTADFAEEYYCEIHGVDTLGPLVNYVDWDRVWEGELQHDFSEDSDHFFRRQ